MKKNEIRRNRFPVAWLVVPALLWATLAGAPIYMKIEGVQGDAVDKDHKNWIVIESMSSAVHVSPAAVRSTGAVLERSGDAVIEDITVTKKVDKSSARLWQACSKGEHIPKVDIYLSSSSGGGSYLYEMRDVMVTSYSVSFGGSSGSGDAGDTVPTETLSLNYDKIKVTYDKQALSKGKGTDRDRRNLLK